MDKNSIEIIRSQSNKHKIIKHRFEAIKRAILNHTKTIHLTHFLPIDRNIEHHERGLGRNWFKRSQRKTQKKSKTKMRQKQVKWLEILSFFGHKKRATKQRKRLIQSKSTKEKEEEEGEKHRTNSVCSKIFIKSL